jgi:hypothetical protein
LIAAAALVAATAVADPAAAGPARASVSPEGRAFAPVVEGVVAGDLLLVGGTNLRAAGDHGTALDADDDTTVRCATIADRRVCADNASGATLDLPTGARVMAARLYVDTTLAADAGPLSVRFDDPQPGFAYRILPAVERAARSPKLYETQLGGLRHAVWDVTAAVAAGGAGRYTIADIVSAPTPDVRPLATWSMVVAYELDPAAAGAISEADRGRFALRQVSWQDGAVPVGAASLDVTLPGVDLPPGAVTFGKGLFVVAGGTSGRGDNVLYDGEPLGNNAVPGDAPPPGGVVLGSTPACNTQTDVLNGSRCLLGRSVGAASGVDADVIRIPDRYLRAAGREVDVRVDGTPGEALVPTVVAMSVDVPGGAA